MSSEDTMTIKDKETVGFLTLGTCLEMFDIFLYIHMAVILDQIFFSKNDTQSWILSNIAFCSVFVFKPIGGFVLGWLGDKIGRTFIVFLSTITTGITCIAIAMMPSYETIGITASFAVTGFRLIQSIMATGEFYSAHIYISEKIRNIKNRYSLGVLLCIGSWVGGKFLATALVSLTLFCFYHGVSEAWRYAFLCGGFIAYVGLYARKTLKESEKFSQKIELQKLLPKEDFQKKISNEKIPKLSLFYYFFLTIGNILFFLFPFTYCKDLLLDLGYKAHEISLQSMCVSIYFTINLIAYFFLVRFFCPLKIVKYRSYGCIFMLLFVPYLIKNSTSNLDIFILQLLVVTFGITCVPASPIIYKLFPVSMRARLVLIPNALSGAIGVIFLNLSFPLLSKYFFNYTFFILAFPVAIISTFGIIYFQKLHESRVDITLA